MSSLNNICAEEDVSNNDVYLRCKTKPEVNFCYEWYPCLSDQKVACTEDAKQCPELIVTVTGIHNGCMYNGCQTVP